jgi:hypothetical protein
MWRRSSKAQALRREYLRIALQWTLSGQKRPQGRVPQLCARCRDDAAV